MIEVIDQGILASVQDLGRYGFANIGVPISGAMDQYSSRLSNAILGNEVSDAALEITFGGCTFLFDKETYISVSGADFSAKVNQQLIPLNKAIHVQKGDVISFGKKRFGVRTYLAVLGGFKTEKVLNSRSLFKGVTSQSKIQKGDCLTFNSLEHHFKATFSSVKINKTHFKTKVLLCFKGPEYELLSVKQKEQLVETHFTISNENSRMGYRLNEKIPNTLNSMLTSGVLPGTVQLTPSGKLIILMRDCQVTGGYPRILVLTHEAINILSQKTTSDSFYFKIIDLSN